MATNGELSDADRQEIRSALEAFAKEGALPYEPSADDINQLARKLKVLGWADLDLIEATMDLDRAMQDAWFEELLDAGIADAVEVPAAALSAVFILTWNPTVYPIDDAEYEESVIATAGGLEIPGNWSVGNRTGGIESGDRAYLLRQHEDRGIVATGYFNGEVYQGEHFNDPTKEANYAPITWTTWLPVDDRLPIEVLLSEVPGVSWDHMQGSGVRVDDPSALDLDQIWDDHVWGIESARPADEVDTAYPEGAVTRIKVNRYERNPRARQACLDHWGYDCAVCGLNFEDRYGSIGQDYIHVHHLKELSTLGDTYEVDPVSDLRPVCPNCHAMLHQERPALTIEALTAKVRN